MTIRTFLTDYLVANGMWPQDAPAVIALATRPECDGGMIQMDRRIDDDLEGYPPAFKAVLALAVNRLALEWIDANKPHAFYRPMFLPETEREALFATPEKR